MGGVLVDQDQAIVGEGSRILQHDIAGEQLADYAEFGVARNRRAVRGRAITFGFGERARS